MAAASSASDPARRRGRGVWLVVALIAVVAAVAVVLAIVADEDELLVVPNRVLPVQEFDSGDRVEVIGVVRRFVPEAAIGPRDAFDGFVGQPAVVAESISFAGEDAEGGDITVEDLVGEDGEQYIGRPVRLVATFDQRVGRAFTLEDD